MTSSRRVVVGLGLGVLTGLLLGDYAAFLKIPADAFVKLLQMTVLPYVMLSLITGLGRLSYAQARVLGLRGGAVLAVLWGIGLLIVFLFPLMLPAIETASFFSTTLLEARPTLNFVELYIPANPFHALANNIVPAVVIFSIFLGAALSGVDQKTRLLEVLGVLNTVVSRATSFVVSLTPYGLFAIAAVMSGTLGLEQLERVQVYLVGYGALALLVSFWILPGLVVAVTPIRYRDVLGVMRDAAVTAFFAADLFIVLPQLIERSQLLLRRHGLDSAERQALPEVVVPASFNFPHIGKLMTLSFVLFAGWFANAAVTIRDYPTLGITGLFVLFGNVNAAIPFLLDLFRIPADTFQLFLATSVINSRFGTLIAVAHTVVMALVGSWAIAGGLQLVGRRIARYAALSVLFIILTVVGTRAISTTLVASAPETRRMVTGLDFTEEPAITATLREPVPLLPASSGTTLEGIRQRGILRVGYLSDNVPYGYLNDKQRLVGFDVEMAHKLARDLGVPLHLVLIERGTIVARLADGSCDVMMAGVVVTADAAERVRFSKPYLDETLAFVVQDHLREQYSTWDSIRQKPRPRIAAVDLPYYVAKIRLELPRAEIVPVESIAKAFEVNPDSIDAILATAERGSAWTLLHPGYSVAVPQPRVIRVPLAYAVSRNDRDMAAFLDTWIDLKARDGTIERLYAHWILGRDETAKTPRWSVIRNVLHWVD